MIAIGHESWDPISIVLKIVLDYGVNEALYEEIEAIVHVYQLIDYRALIYDFFGMKPVEVWVKDAISIVKKDLVETDHIVYVEHEVLNDIELCVLLMSKDQHYLENT